MFIRSNPFLTSSRARAVLCNFGRVLCMRFLPTPTPKLTPGHRMSARMSARHQLLPATVLWFGYGLRVEVKAEAGNAVPSSEPCSGRGRSVGRHFLGLSAQKWLICMFMTSLLMELCKVIPLSELYMRDYLKIVYFPRIQKNSPCSLSASFFSHTLCTYVTTSAVF